jgi:hypothetical protein
MSDAGWCVIAVIWLSAAVGIKHLKDHRLYLWAAVATGIIMFNK